ncbi:MAG: hypothetical protein ACMUIU_10730 [bacterium]
MKKVWIIPLISLLVLDLIMIIYFKYITITFIITSACIILTGQITDIEPVINAGSFLFLSSLGLGITQAIMNIFRGRPGTGSRFFASQVSFLLKLFGKDADVVVSSLFFQGKKITCDLMKMGFFPWLAFVLGFIAFILVAKGKARRKIYVIIGGILIHYIYLLGRFSVISAITPNIMFAGPVTFNLFYWRIPIVSFVFLIPLWFFLLYESSFFEFNNPIYDLSPVRFVKRDLWIFFAITCSVFLFTLCFVFHGFAKPRKIHCVIDEIHSDWESTLIDFNAGIFGSMAENSYHSFLDYLRHFYPITIMTNKPVMDPGLEGVELFNTPIITPDVLNSIKSRHPETQPVLILKCVTTPFFSEEIDTLKDFVLNGGSLFLIGDHTDVFFMNKNLNELSNHFGIRFEQNSVYFIDGGWVITDPLNYRIHPANQFSKRFIWATGDSLKISRPAFPLIYSSHVSFADEVNYFYENFFGNTKIDADEVFGSFCIMAGSRYGKGKIIAFTDSTCFNNYLMFSVGRRDLIAGVFGWLGSKGSRNPFPLLAYLSFCFLGVVLIKRWPGIDKLIYLLIVGIIIGWSAGYILSVSLNYYSYPRPAPIKPLPDKVIIDASHNPLHSMSYGNSESFLSSTSYDNLLYNIGRIDIFSRIFYEGVLTKGDLEGSSCLIIASPTKKYCEKEKNSIKYYVRKGGSLLLVEGANLGSSINQIANLFGFHFRLDPYREKVKKMKETLVSNNRENLKINPGWVDGGISVFEYDNMPVICYKREGKGLILAIGDDGLFIKDNFQNFTVELVNYQCDIVSALLSKDENALESIRWNYLERLN